MNYRGVPRRVMYALRQIEKDEILYHNYSRRYFQNLKCPPIELAPTHVDRFVAETQQLQTFNFGATKHGEEWLFSQAVLQKGKIIAQAVPLNGMPEEYLRLKLLEGNFSVSMLQYLYEFPDRLHELVKEKKIPKDRVQELFTALRACPVAKDLIHPGNR